MRPASELLFCCCIKCFPIELCKYKFVIDLSNQKKRKKWIQTTSVNAGHYHCWHFEWSIDFMRLTASLLRLSIEISIITQHGWNMFRLFFFFFFFSNQRYYTVWPSSFVNFYTYVIYTQIWSALIIFHLPFFFIAWFHLFSFMDAWCHQ